MKLRFGKTLDIMNDFEFSTFRFRFQRPVTQTEHRHELFSLISISFSGFHQNFDKGEQKSIDPNFENTKYPKRLIELSSRFKVSQKSSELRQQNNV
jgi:hypothetical protein